MDKTRSAHEAALGILLPTPELKAAHDRRVQDLVDRNRMLQALDAASREEGVSRKVLAERAGLNASSVRRLLTAETANPTASTMIRLFKAAHARVEVVLPSGQRLEIA